MVNDYFGAKMFGKSASEKVAMNELDGSLHELKIHWSESHFMISKQIEFE